MENLYGMKPFRGNPVDFMKWGGGVGGAGGGGALSTTNLQDHFGRAGPVQRAYGEFYEVTLLT